MHGDVCILRPLVTMYGTFLRLCRILNLQRHKNVSSIFKRILHGPTQVDIYMFEDFVSY